MKKTILSVALLLVLGVSSFANNNEGVNQKASNSFSKEFNTAKDVKWDNGREFSKVTFTLNGQVMFAYYTSNGEKLAMSRNIVSSQLPINLLNDLKKIITISGSPIFSKWPQAMKPVIMLPSKMPTQELC